MRIKRTLAVGAAGAAVAYLFDPDRGRGRRARLRDRVLGMGNAAGRDAQRMNRAMTSDVSGWARRVENAVTPTGPRIYDDATLKAKVESELFSDPGLPKGRINVSVEGGTVVLRGTVDRVQEIRRIRDRVARMDGVMAVDSLLHAPQTEARNKTAAKRASRRAAEELATVGTQTPSPQRGEAGPGRAGGAPL